MSLANLPHLKSLTRDFSKTIKILSFGALMCTSQVHASSFTTKFLFAGWADGSTPVSRLTVVAPQGNNQPSHLWGTTTVSGQIFDYYAMGNVNYESSPASFPQGVVPNSPLLQVPRPIGEILFYGTATGGLLGNGVIYKYSSLTPANIVIVHQFTGSCVSPSGGSLALVRYGKAVKGQPLPQRIVGTTGRTNCGGPETIYEIDLAGNFKILHTFTGRYGGDGAWPNGLVSPDNGAGSVVYGSLGFGGPTDAGYVFALNAASGQLSPVCNLTYTYGYKMNYSPNSDLTYAYDPYLQTMKLYGTSAGDIYSGFGALFECNPQNGEVYALHYFADYNYPPPRDHSYYSKAVAGAPVVANGKVYGTAVTDDGTERGVIYSYDQMTGQYQHEFVFAGGNQGSGAPGGLTLLGNGLYGTTPDGGYGAGILFKFQY